MVVVGGAAHHLLPGYLLQAGQDTSTLILTVITSTSSATKYLTPVPPRHLLGRKLHGSQLARIHLTSGECFVLEMIVDNLSQTPRLIDQVGSTSFNFDLIFNHTQ